MSLEHIVFKFFGWLLNIDWIILFLLFLGLVLLYTRLQRWGRMFFVTGFLILICTSVVPTGFWIINALENHFPAQTDVPEDAVGIILLGGSYDWMISADRRRPSYNATAGRMIDFVELALRYPHLKLLFTGGGRYADAFGNESYNAKITFKGLGLDLDRITFEDKSRTTYENATHSFEVIKPKPHEKWVLVTSACHMPRSVALFRAAGWNIIPYPVDYHTPKSIPWYFINFNLSTGLVAWSMGIREIGGMTTNYLAGHTKVWIPE